MLGIFAAIIAAFSWTLSCFIWRTQTSNFSAAQVNLIKNIIASFIFLPILFSFNWLSYLKEIPILLLSGLIGIAIGDSLYIAALKRLGTRRTLSIECLSPVLANLLGAIFTDEVLPLNAWIGASIVTCSLILITRQRTTNNDKEVYKIVINHSGYIYALLSVLCAILAAILSRFVLINSNLSPLETTEIRLLGASFFLLPIIRIDLKYLLHKVSLENKLKLLSATLLGTNLGIFLQQTVFQILPIGLGWTLLSISPIIALLFSKAEGERINNATIFMSLTVFLGVVLALL